MTTTIHASSGQTRGGPGFKTDLDIRLQDNGLWVLLSDLVWQGTEGDVLIVKAGEETDFASVPRWLQALLPSADPRVVRAAVVHDFLCRELNDWRRKYADNWHKAGTDDFDVCLYMGVGKPAFTAVDADAIFKKIMADEGAGWWMQNIGWVGVRYGALANPARRGGWRSTAWPVLWRSTVFLCLTLAILALLCLVVPW